MDNEPTINEQKTLLSMNSEAFKYGMEDELDKLGLKARRAGTTAILVGGGFLLLYVIAKKLLSLNKPASIKNGSAVMFVQPKKESMIVSLIKEQIALFLFAIAKQQLELFLKSLDKKTTGSSVK